MGDNRTPEQREEAQEKKADVLARRRRGETFAAIGAAHGVTMQRAHQIYSAALREITAGEVAELRTEQAERLDELLREAYAVLKRKHLTISGGKVVRIGEPVIDEETGEAVIREEAGEPVYDDGPTLAAIKTILAIEERRARLFGLDVPVKQHVEMDGGIRYEIVGVDLEGLR